MAKHVIIVRRNCHEFANKMRSDMAIYAYAFLVKARVWNLAAFETGPFAPFHTAIAAILGRLSTSAQYIFLPPTAPLAGKFLERKALFFFGWLFGNPEGFARYRRELLLRFGPTAREEKRLKKALSRLPAGRIRIGVHLRLKPLRYFPDGEFLVPPERVEEIVTEYLQERSLTPDEVALVVVSDLPVPGLFANFVSYAPRTDERTGFFLLSKCSVVIGTNTTYSNLAAWFGDVPHIVTTKRPIDWAYYAEQQRYFENTYATFAFGLPGRE